MSYKGLPENLVGRVRPIDARRYAAASGWVRRRGTNGKLAIYSHPGSDLDQLLIPIDSATPDYPDRMAEVVANLSDREGRPAVEILNDLLIPPSDVLRFRLSEPEAESGTLPLGQGIDLLMGARNALLSAACSVIQPQTYHPRLSRTEAKALVESTRMGQTERGSFTVTIACPLGEGREDSLPLLAGIEADEPGVEDTPAAARGAPFARQAIVTLMQSLARMDTAIDSDDIKPLESGDGDTPPLSANLCDALLMMQPSGDRSRLTVTATWSSSIPHPPAERTPSTVQLRGEQFPAIESLSRTLRPAFEPKSTHLVGLVDDLYGDPGADGVAGDVQLLIFNQEQPTRARATLGPSDYEIALEAHRVGGFVSLHGVLIRVGRLHRIESIRDFSSLNVATPSGA